MRKVWLGVALLAGLQSALLAADFDGDGTGDIAYFRSSSGLWSIRNLTKVYFGKPGDVAIGAITPAGGLLKTGQMRSYRAGDDGTYQKGRAFRYTDNGNGTVTDNVTGLMWAKDGIEAGCNFGSETDWDSAIDWAESLDFAGYSDWRLPNRRELESLVTVRLGDPAIDNIFSNTLGSYWSSTMANDVIYPYYVETTFGNVSFDWSGYTHNVRAVRGGE